MAVGRVAGHPNYSSDGTSKFIPEVWSGKLIKKFYDATVLTAISNTDYEGEIKKHGDKINIRTTPDVTIRNYTKGAALNYERLESPAVELVIDKAKYYAFTVDRIDKYQSDITLLSKWAADAAEKMKIAIDTDVLGSIYPDTSAYNRGTTAGYRSGNINLGLASGGSGFALTKLNIIDKIVDFGQCLDEINVPESGRFIVIPAWAASLLKKSELRDASITGSGSTIKNGLLGTIDKFSVLVSNLLPTASDGTRTCTYMYFGTKDALSFASQITESESLKAESTFGDLVRGLQVYGYKVLNPLALGTFVGYAG
jgi:hypothetical protein